MILAGGRSTRFGSDKALAPYRGKPLLLHVRDALAPQCDRLVIAGREWPGLEAVPDRPGPGHGPLGGLSAALHLALAQGFAEVVSAPCDLLGLPADLATRLAPGPSVARGHWLLGLWPAATAPDLSGFLLAGNSIAARSFALAAGAREVHIPGLLNVNVPADLPMD